MPRISVVMATCNRACFIRDAIDSVLSQTFSDIELIIIDDGSVDETKEVVTFYSDKVRYYYQANRGQAAALNVGVSLARGEYVAFIDDDDVWLPNKLELQIRIFKKDPNVGIVGTEMYLTDERGEIKSHWEGGPPDHDVFASLVEYNFLGAPSIMVRKKFVDQVGGFDESLRTTHDYDLWLRMARICKIHYVHKPLVKWRIHGGNKHKDKVRKLKDRVRVITKPGNMFHLSGYQRLVRIAKEYYNHAQFFQDAGKYGLASMTYLRAIMACPFIGRYYPASEVSGFRSTRLFWVLRTYLKAGYYCLRALQSSLQRKMFLTKEREIWGIGIYRLMLKQGRFEFLDHPSVRNPVLTAADIKDINADYVADPFLVRDNKEYFLFFEVFESGKGKIGFAVSHDCKKWKYQGLILDMPYHLSYPFVFKHGEQHYMLPETHQVGAVKLFKAVKFPDKWCFDRTLISGKAFVDPTLVFLNGVFWLFVADTDANLYLYYANDLQGEWKEHPQSPIVRNNKRSARPGGQMIAVGARLVRLAQDDWEDYGVAVRAFEIMKLNVSEYSEMELPESPLLKASGAGWNKDGMHHVSVLPISDGVWVAAVDGKRLNEPKGPAISVVPL